MEKKVATIIVIISLSLFGFATARLPPYIQVCRRNDPQLSECIRQAILALQPRIASGEITREFRIPPVEPFKIEHLAFGNDRSLKVTVTNLLIRGGSNFRIEKLRTNLNDLKFDAIVSFPRLEITGKYKFILKLLSAPIQSDGDLYTVYDNSKARISMKGRLFNQNGINYMKFDPIAIKVQQGKVKTLKLSNLFGGSPVLSEIVQSLLISNSDFLLNDMYPYIERSLSQIFTGLANKITADTSFDQVFP